MTIQINKTVLTNLVDEFNTQVKLCEELGEIEGQSKEKIVVELAKAMGIASAMSYEAAALSSDILKEIKIYSNPNSDNVLESILDAMPTTSPKVSKDN